MNGLPNISRMHNRSRYHKTLKCMREMHNGFLKYEETPEHEWPDLVLYRGKTELARMVTRNDLTRLIVRKNVGRIG